MAPVEVIVETVEGLPRGKALTGGVFGDVNGDGQVTLDDALLVMTYVADIADGVAVALPISSMESPYLPLTSLWAMSTAMVKSTLDDALLVMTYVVNPADGSLPAEDRASGA